MSEDAEEEPGSRSRLRAPTIAEITLFFGLAWKVFAPPVARAPAVNTGMSWTRAIAGCAPPRSTVKRAEKRKWVV